MVMVFGDNLKRRGLPLATWSIICASTVSFLFCNISEKNYQSSLQIFGFIPLEFSQHPLANSYRLFTALFIHLDYFHLIGNLLFLFALGRAIENTVGRLVFLSSFVGLGALAFFGSWLFDPTSSVPIIGNSGAVSFVLGGYSLLFPRAKIRIIPFLNWPNFRAWLFALVWFAIQTYNALTTGEGSGGVAYWTHFAGFLIGLAAAAIWREFAEDTDRLVNGMMDIEK